MHLEALIEKHITVCYYVDIMLLQVSERGISYPW